MEQLIETNLSTYGPIAVFMLLMLSGIGLALGEEMVTIPAGVLVATGRLEFASTALSAYVGIVLADFLWFRICSHYGTPILHRRWFKRLVHPRRLLETKHQFEQRGAWLVVMSRFIPSSRTTTITVAGMFHMTFWKFAVTTAVCVLFTVPLQLGLGYLIGMGLDEKRSVADLMLHIIGLVLVIAAVTFAIGWWSRRRAKRTRLPRAKASWLRRFRPRRGNGAHSAGPAPGRPDAPRTPESEPENPDVPARNESAVPSPERERDAAPVAVGGRGFAARGE